LLRVRRGKREREGVMATAMEFDPSKMVAQRRDNLPDEWNRLTERVIGAAMEVHSLLGPGLREKFYELALLHELTKRGMRWAQQVPFRVIYKECDLGVQFVDTIVEDTVVLELKAAAVTEVDRAQLIGYLRFTGLPLGLLINFQVAHLRDGISRKINWPPADRTTVRSIRPPSSSVTSVIPSPSSVNRL
jgi:GxxExxY protein